jgi:propionyl-CoA carboxylase alpha chain
VRLYAEDPTRNFLPVAGRLTRFSVPTDPGIRLDSGVESGSEISVFYDPMLAKVIAHAPTRREAALALAATLQRSQVHGSITNRDLLVNILRHPEFLSGDTDTAFLERNDPAVLGKPLHSTADAGEMALAAALFDHDVRRATLGVLATLPSGWRNNPSDPQAVTFTWTSGEVTVGYSFGRSGPTVSFDGSDPVAFAYDIEGDAVHLEIAGRRRSYRVAKTDAVFDVDGPTGHLRLLERERFPTAAGVADTRIASRPDAGQGAQRHGGGR